MYHLIASLGHPLNPESVYLIDSFPLAVCDNIRIQQCRRHRGEVWRGYQASQRRCFHSLKIHRLVTAQDNRSPVLALAAMNCCSAWRMSSRLSSSSKGKPVDIEGSIPATESDMGGDHLGNPPPPFLIRATGQQEMKQSPGESPGIQRHRRRFQPRT